MPHGPAGDSPALRTALAYFEAWTNKDLDAAAAHLADGFVCDAPPGRLEGVAAFRAFMAPFVQILVGARLIASFGDDTTAVLVYDTETVPVTSAPAAETLTVVDGKITYNRFIFDRLPFDAARKAGG
ncbi:nuclear transport factor 2 family protein [Rhodococcus sp. D2-41]|uniref:Nuclear transport factor 2 family protein n=1 Tax=Speluncibacter jeojiensis TaxID=2710754 RepID=A0A9X4M299_9ACTN|nr:nuclear transport factor 2 family protein [Rhodococcus sp. D2-41]MDG3011724.1 nuclear transport factor 2 family protein [Rhodococcus sp. D2-41]MDG3014922.1 nuclear transport factor 2 family protein [Corynebacteriales bacterium D3-21]